MLARKNMAGQTKISLPMFRRMLGRITPQQLRDLPVESLPDEIPLDLIDEAPPELREVLEDLSFSLGSSHLGGWEDDRERFGKEVASAIEYASQHRPETAAEAFDEAVARLKAEWREKGKSGTPPLEFTKRLQHLGSVRELQDEAGRLGRAVGAIDSAMAEHGQDERMVEARRALMEDFKRIEQSLAAYHSLSIELVRLEMRQLREQVEAHAFDDQQLADRLDVLHEKRNKSQSWLRRSLRPALAQKEREQLENKIAELMKQRQDREWVIDENDMTRWLDSVVEANLYLDERKHAQALRDARMQLFRLLNLFCLQQEESAKQVARNPFLQLDPQQAIEFLLVSERFIVGYFAQKRKDLTRWLGGAAEQKLQELDQVQSGILAEYRRHKPRS